MTTRLRQFFRVCAIPALLVCTGPALCADIDFGKPGEPIKLVVGHPSHYAATWSVHVLHGKEFWKKYLPAGSTVEYQTGLAVRKLKSPVGAVAAMPDSMHRK